jgi:hypothetical protein
MLPDFVLRRFAPARRFFYRLGTANQFGSNATRSCNIPNMIGGGRVIAEHETTIVSLNRHSEGSQSVAGNAQPKNFSGFPPAFAYLRRLFLFLRSSRLTLGKPRRRYQTLFRDSHIFSGD